MYTQGIDPAGTHDTYELVLDDRLREFVGKLFISWGAGTRSWVQRPDNQNKPITELHPELKDPEFPGFLTFISNLLRHSIVVSTALLNYKMIPGLVVNANAYPGR